MATFYTVTAGNQTLAADINQYANYLNGTTTGGALVINGGAGATTPYSAALSALAASGNSLLFNAYVSGDTVGRVQVFLSQSGVPYLVFANGTSNYGNLYGVSGGMKTDNALTVAGAFSATGGASANTLSVSGTTSVAGLTSSGAVQVNSNFTVTGTTSLGANSTASGEPLLVNASQATLCQVFTGTATPTGAVAGDLWIRG